MLIYTDVLCDGGVKTIHTIVRNIKDPYTLYVLFLTKFTQRLCNFKVLHSIINASRNILEKYYSYTI